MSKLANSGTADQVKGAAREAWGNIKDAAGAVSDDAHAHADAKAEAQQHAESTDTMSAKRSCQPPRTSKTLSTSEGRESRANTSARIVPSPGPIITVYIGHRSAQCGPFLFAQQNIRREEAKNATEITPFSVKNAAFIRRRSRGDTMLCSYSRSAATVPRPPPQAAPAQTAASTTAAGTAFPGALRGQSRRLAQAKRLGHAVQTRRAVVFEILARVQHVEAAHPQQHRHRQHHNPRDRTSRAPRSTPPTAQCPAPAPAPGATSASPASCSYTPARSPAPAGASSSVSRFSIPAPSTKTAAETATNPQQSRAQPPCRQSTHRGPRIRRVQPRVYQPVEGHRSRPRRDHAHHNPNEHPHPRPATRRQHCAGQRKRQREHRVLPLIISSVSRVLVQRFPISPSYRRVLPRLLPSPTPAERPAIGCHLKHPGTPFARIPATSRPTCYPPHRRGSHCH